MRCGLAAALSALVASCFTPRVEPCALECGPGRACPPGSTCRLDGFCYQSGDEGLCPAADSDAGVADAAFGDAAVSDAALFDAGPGCGNGIIEGDLDEECDDGDVEAEDGCDEACAVESFFICTGEPSQCRRRPISPGDVIITEIFKDPAGQQEVEPGEWFEVHNPTSTEWDLLGVEVDDQGTDQFVINTSLPIEPNETLVFAASSDPEENGGLVPDFAFSQDDFILANKHDEVRLFVADSTTILDRVDYNEGNFPDAPGASMSLDPASYDDVDNDSGANWCDGDEVYGDGSGLGTPGMVNPSCTP